MAKVHYLDERWFKMANDWQGCCKAAGRLADLVCAMYHPKDERSRKVFPTSTWAEIIAAELNIPTPEETEAPCGN